MKYQIESKNDMSGLKLVIRFPEKDLDTKALYTIQADQPEFLVPFRFLCVNGEVECTYQLENRGKLLYHCAKRSPGELTDFWGRVLQPLLDCGDWFLKPFSFVLELQYLYMDKDGKTISYLYIPSKEDCSSLEDLRGLAVDLAQKNPSIDAELEVKVLRAIMQDFQPNVFLQMLRKNQPALLDKTLSAPVVPPPPPPRPGPAPTAQPAPKASEPATPKAEDIALAPKPVVDDGGIHIDLSGARKPEKPKKGLFRRKEKPEKKKEKKEGGLFGKKKEPAKEPEKEKGILLGAAAEAPVNIHAVTNVTVFSAEEEDDGVTVLDVSNGSMGCRFRLVGISGLPREIPVALDLGGVFTIGRFDVTVGHRQSDFEFESKTKEVSRRHAAVECLPDGGYTIVDLNSSAGTYVDGERLNPNVARRLSSGSRVAFGTAGAEYIWEE